MAASKLWTEAYRPTTLAGYVFRDKQQRAQIEQWIKEKALPNLIFSGSPGTGKSTLSLLLCNELEVNPLDILMLNASRTNSIDDVRVKITNFIQMIPFGDFKVVILDEFDHFSSAGMAALRGLIEEYSNTARFIFTANYPHRILPAIHSRCQGFHIERLDEVEYTSRVAEILVTENIDFELDVLDTFVKASYPDLRKCINNLQMNSIDGKLKLPDRADANESDYKIAAIELFKAGKISQARTVICGQIKTDEIEDMYRFCYDNLNLFGKDERQQEQAILIIKQGLVDHTICSDPEIALAATLIRLARNLES